LIGREEINMEKGKKNYKNPIIRMLINIKENDKSIFVLCAIYSLAVLALPFFKVALPKVLIDYLTGLRPRLWGIIWIVAVFCHSKSTL
jgi:hypothetical protein